MKSRGGKSQRREEKIREEKESRRKKIRDEKESEERRCRREKLCFSNDLSLRRVEK
jgi:hypothetical protein